MESNEYIIGIEEDDSVEDAGTRKNSQDPTMAANENKRSGWTRRFPAVRVIGTALPPSRSATMSL